MRLNFSGVGDEEIREGIRRIGNVIAEQVELYGTLTGDAAPASSDADGLRPDAGPSGERPAVPQGRREGGAVKVAVLKGGKSLERGVSLRSGARVENALARLGHEVVSLDVGADLVERLLAEQPDVAFIALHGRGGEDGTAQELLEILGIPFTGPGVAACALCTDKVLAKHALRAAGHPDPALVRLQPDRLPRARRGRGARRARGATRLPAGRQARTRRLGARGPLRRRRGGDARGARLRLQLRRPGPARALRRRPRAGGQRARLRAAADRRGDPEGGDRYDFEARYEIGRTRFECPAELSDIERDAVVEAALGAYRALGCSGFSRVDLILGEDGPQVLEVNAIPGLTDTSLLPQAAEAAGLGFEELVERILELALEPSAAAG